VLPYAGQLAGAKRTGAADKAVNLGGCKSPHRQLLGLDG